MRNEVIISDLAGAVREKDRLADFSTADRWEVVSYETAAVTGNLLIASEETMPEPVTIVPELTGWYRIYVCMADTGGGFPSGHVHLKLTDDPFSRCVGAGNMGPYCIWHQMEVVEEAFWKCADMTGQSITIEKIDDNWPHTANVLWFRFVPMEEAEVQAHLAVKHHRTMLAHWDGDFHRCDAARSPQDYCKGIYAVQDSDIGILCQEVMNDQIDYSRQNPAYRYRKGWSQHRENYFRALSENRETVYAEQIAYAHRHDMQMFAAHRMQLSNFSFPMAQPIFEIPFVREHPELRCQARDGRYCGFLSYGYREVQDFVIGMMLESAAQGFDGVEHIWIRGQHLLFEEPVLERFREKFPDAPDCRRLPAEDPRLMEVRSDIMTDFYRRLRKALQTYAAEHGTKPLKVYTTAYFEPETSKKDSLDVERWAAEGLIDGIVQCKAAVWEETDDVLAEDGMIDLAGYEEKANTRFLYKRHFGNDIARIAAGVPAYRAIADRYGIDFHSEIQWESSVPAEEFVKAAKQIYSAGGKGIALWDTYPSRPVHLAEWAASCRLGEAEAVLAMPDNTGAYHTIHKVLSFGGQDMRYVHPCWRG